MCAYLNHRTAAVYQRPGFTLGAGGGRPWRRIQGERGGGARLLAACRPAGVAAGAGGCAVRACARSTLLLRGRRNRGGFGHARGSLRGESRRQGPGLPERRPRQCRWQGRGGKAAARTHHPKARHTPAARYISRIGRSGCAHRAGSDRLILSEISQPMPVRNSFPSFILRWNQVEPGSKAPAGIALRGARVPHADEAAAIRR